MFKEQQAKRVQITTFGSKERWFPPITGSCFHALALGQRQDQPTPPFQRNLAFTSVSIFSMSSSIKVMRRGGGFLHPLGWHFLDGPHSGQCVCLLNKRSTGIKKLYFSEPNSSICISVFMSDGGWSLRTCFQLMCAVWFVLRAAALAPLPKSRQSCCRLLWRGQGAC